MSKKIRELYDSLLLTCSDGKFIEKNITGFVFQKGSNYSGYLFYGRAVNGWTIDWSPPNAKKKEDREKIIDEIFDQEAEMDWVYELQGPNDIYNTNKSAFWRIIRKFTGVCNIADIDRNWPSYLAWSNLYKISNAIGGNPSDKLCTVQFEMCKAILIEEIQILKPRFIIFLTGSNWADHFLENFYIDIQLLDLNFIEKFGKLKFDNVTTNFILGKHPQGKNEDIYLTELDNIYKQF